MQTKDLKEFTSILKSVMETYGKEMSESATKIWWATMEEISIEDFRLAMTKHIKTNQFFPKPADILNQFKTFDGRPGAEEAWAMIPKDEYGSVVWTEEMAIAFGACSPLLNDGDKIGARMAFKEAYEREIEARKGLPIKWIPSFGTDRQGRESALETAVYKNRLPAEKALKFMPESEGLMQLSGQELQRLENKYDIKGLIEKIGKSIPEETLTDESILLENVHVNVKQPQALSNNIVGDKE